MLEGQLREVDGAEVERFWADGVVHLRGILDPDLITGMEAAVEAAVENTATTADLSEMGNGLAASGDNEVLADRGAGTTGGNRGRFRSGTDHWLHDERFRWFACDSPLPRIVARILRSARLYLWEDSVLVKEPGTIEPTAFHTDMAYFNVTGKQVCTTWSPLDPANRDSGGVGYVRGSHLWDRDFRPNLFVSTTPLPDTVGELVPDVLADPDSYDLVFFETVPGDVIVHHARTLHGAEGNKSATTRRRAISVRYCGDDARFHTRPGAPTKAHHSEMNEGDTLDHPMSPLVWTSAGTAD